MCVRAFPRARVGGADKSSELTNKEVTQSLEGLKGSHIPTVRVCSVGVFGVYQCVCVW